jgi:hypothetical protein
VGGPAAHKADDVSEQRNETRTWSEPPDVHYLQAVALVSRG